MSKLSHLPEPANDAATVSARGSRALGIGLRAAALLLLAPLGACGVNRVLPPPVVAADYQDRHPIVLADAPTTLDIFPRMDGPRLDTATVGRIRDFARRARRFGDGRISLRIRDFARRARRFGDGRISLVAPNGAATPVQNAVIREVERTIAANGARGSVVGSYPVADPNLAAPIRLTYTGVKAKVASRCGEWPGDLASASSLEGWENRTYHNFGCSNQSMLAAQVADPRDIVTPRGEEPTDIEMRMRGIDAVRKGADPSTTWKSRAASFGGLGGN
jgi:pilus assembly protein CpaD